jgi:hypothetical protein
MSAGRSNLVQLASNHFPLELGEREKDIPNPPNGAKDSLIRSDTVGSSPELEGSRPEIARRSIAKLPLTNHLGDLEIIGACQ